MTSDEKVKFANLLNSGKFEEARIFLLPLYKNNRDDYEINYHLGLLYRATGHLEYSKHFLERAIDFNPEETSARYTLGIVYQIEGNFRKSVQLFKKVVEIDPLFYSAYNSLGLTFKKNGKLKPALENYLLSQSIYIKKILLDLKEFPEPLGMINYGFTNIKSDYWKETVIGNIHHIAALDGIESVNFPTAKTVGVMMKSNKFDTIPWRDEGKRRFVNFTVFALVFSRLISDPFYCTICFNIGNLLIELEKFEDAKIWLKESIEFIPYGFKYNEPYKALAFIESLE